MALISGSIPNMINGVSQQPPALRLKTQAETQINGLSSVVDGLRKRPGTEHVAKLTVPISENAYVHTIRRDENEFYTVIIQDDGSISVFDKFGVERIVEGDTSYLSGITSANTDLVATSVADYTFIANKTKTVLQSDEVSDSRPFEALIYVKQGDYKVDYTIKVEINGTSYTSTKTTLDSSNASNASDITTTKIATDLMNGLNAPGVTKTLYGSTIHLTSATDFTVSASDGRGDTFVLVFKGNSKDVNKLPPKGPAGFKIKIIGENAKEQDDYYVSLQAVADNGTQVWKETMADGIPYKINNTTMPHVLKKRENGSFVFEPVEWDERAAGDDKSNPFPSFVGFKINDVFFYRNRLGILSDENAIFSEAGNYYNFFMPTVLTFIDSNPIDIAVSNNQVSILKHAVPFNESLLLFSDLTQFQLDSTDTFTADSVSINVATQFEASTKAKPQAAGRFVFFPFLRGAYSGIREYFVDKSTDNKDATDTTAHVPNYLVGDVRRITTSSNEDMMLVLTEGARNYIYVYKYYWNGNEKLQSSWSIWDMGDEVVSCEFNKSDIVILMKRPDGLCLEKINLSADTSRGLTEGEFSVLLDRRYIISDQAPEVDYVDSRMMYVDLRGNPISEARVPLSLAEDGLVFAGIPYEFRYTFSEILMRKENEPITQGRLQLRRLSISYSNSSYFRVEVTPAQRDSSVTTFTGRVIGGASTKLGYVPVVTGNFNVPILANAQGTKVSIINDSFLPCVFQAAEWEGFFVLRSARQ